MEILENRLLSFNTGPQKWPHSQNRYFKATPEQFSQAGFYFDPTTEFPDNVVCYLCSKNLDGWEPSDDPFQEHLSHSPQCAYAILKCRPQPSVADTQNGTKFPFLRNDIDSWPTSSLMEKARLECFGKWWPYNGKKGWTVTKKNMAKAGFYYAPTRDSKDTVCCIYCGICLDGWKPRDNPTKEHQRRVPDCPFFIEPSKDFDASISKIVTPTTTIRKGRLKIAAVSSLSIKPENKWGTATQEELTKDAEESDQEFLDAISNATPSISIVEPSEKKRKLTRESTKKRVTRNDKTRISTASTAMRPKRTKKEKAKQSSASDLSSIFEISSVTPAVGEFLDAEMSGLSMCTTDTPGRVADTARQSSTPAQNDVMATPFWLPDPEILPRSPITAHQIRQKYSDQTEQFSPPPYESEDETPRPHKTKLPIPPSQVDLPPDLLNLTTKITLMPHSDLPIMELTAEEKVMLVEEYMKRMIERQCELLKKEAERMINDFKNESELVRKAIEMM